MTRLSDAVNDVVGLIDSGETLTAVDRILAYKKDPESDRIALIRTLIAIAQDTSNRELARCAIDAVEVIKNKIPKDLDTYYYIANGYQLLYADLFSAFDFEHEISQAIRYYERAGSRNVRALVNLANLFDSIGRPIEAIDGYEKALALDPEFAMAIGNKGQLMESLAPASRYSTSLLIYAHQLYESALENPKSLYEVGGQSAIDSFTKRDDAVIDRIEAAGALDALNSDLRHGEYDSDDLSLFVRFYIEISMAHDLYLNLHIVDKRANASIGDKFLPRFHVNTGDEHAMQYVDDIALRLNEINESFMTARMLFVRSQFIDEDSSLISEQTMLINSLDYSVSNIYVGQLKAAYKEGFSALDKVAVLLNHYLKIGHSEENVYYSNVWYEPGTTEQIATKVREQGYRLVGLYLLCKQLNGSKFSHLRNAMTHRYLRVFRFMSPPKGAYDFDELVQLTGEILHTIKCIIMQMTIFIDGMERRKRGKSLGQVGQLPLNTGQNLDLWQTDGPSRTANQDQTS